LQKTTTAENNKKDAVLSDLELS